VVLLVVTLLLGGLLVPLTTQVQQRKVGETQQMLEDIKEALIGFAASHVDASNHPYLPCPDVTAAVAGQAAMIPNDGQEDRCQDTNGACAPPAVGAGACPVKRGNLPWVTLGTASADSWGNRFRYQVTRNFANSSTGFTLDTAGDIMISNKDSDKNTSSLVTTAPALVMSFGPNGYGAIHEDNNTQAAPPAQNADETTNTAPLANPGYISRTPSALQPALACSDIKPGEPFCEFDDMVTWLSPNILFNRMIAAGRLP
jgi:type II secretory pathway pseudopilin PulG